MIRSYPDRNRVIVDPITGIAANVEQDGSLAVAIQDQHTTAIDLYFIQALAAPTTLSVAADPGDMSITVTSTTGFADGVSVAISSEGNFYQGLQVGALAGNVVTLDTPIDQPHAIGSFTLAATRNMNVDGSGAAEIFQIGPVGADTDVDITRIMGYIQTGGAMDDALFGDITALTNGIAFRQNHAINGYTNLWNAKSNSDLALICFDFVYTTKAPAGSFGARFRNTYAGQNKHGVTLRLAQGDTLELLIQDDIDTLEEFRMMAQGHLVTG